MVKGAAKGVTPEATQLVEKAVVRVAGRGHHGPHGAQGSGQSRRCSVPEGSTAASRILAYSELVAKGIGKDVDLPAVHGQHRQGGCRARSHSVDELVQLAVERYGPLKTVEMAGGWKHLASALGTDSAAGKVILSWRDAIYRDLKAFVEGELSASRQGNRHDGQLHQRPRHVVPRQGGIGQPRDGPPVPCRTVGARPEPRDARQDALHRTVHRSATDAPVRPVPGVRRRAGQEDGLVRGAADLELRAQAGCSQYGPPQARAGSHGELGIKVIDDFKPLSDRAAGVLAGEQDRIAAEIEELAAREAPDKALLSKGWRNSPIRRPRST